MENLGWTLLHFLWQGLVIAAVYAGIRKRLKPASSPNARYLLACAALALMIASPLITWIVLRPSGPIPDPVYRIHGALPSTAVVPVALPASVRTAVPSAIQPQILPWVVAFWILGAAAFWVRLAGAWLFAARLRSAMVRPAPPEWQAAFRSLAAQVGVSRPVRLLVSGFIQVPAVVGCLRPVVLLPVGALTGVPREHLEAVLMHELAHIQRHDYLVNILQGVAEAMLFYHPAVWWISGQIRAERELCCDDVAVEIGGDALAYARALVEWESHRPAHAAATVAANGGSLASRVGRLLGQPCQPARDGVGVLAAAILLAAGAYTAFAQSAARPVFQAASVKPNTETNARGMMVMPQPGGRLTSKNAPLIMLLQNAYSVQAFQIIGGPPWINSTGYDIEAKPDAAVDRPQMWQMLQNLLADRFKLELHRETRELPLFALTVAKGSFQPPPPKEGTCIDTPPDAPPGPPGAGQTQCGRGRISMSPAGLAMDGGKVQMAELIRLLAIVLGRPVLDRTAFDGKFDFHLTFTPDESTMGLPGSGGPRAPNGPLLPTDPDRPTIFAALQEQLGLKLVTAKGPVEVLVIDHVERPTAN